MWYIPNVTDFRGHNILNNNEIAIQTWNKVKKFKNIFAKSVKKKNWNNI